MWPSAVLPVLGYTVVPYDLIHHAARITCVVLVTVLNRRRGIPAWKTIAIALLCVPFGYWGSRALDIVEYRSAYPSIDAALWRTGSSIYGGLIASFVVVAISTPLFGVRVLTFLDGAAPVLAFAEAITRLGCFSAGCCYGVPWDGPWAVTFPHGSLAFSDLVERGLLDPSALHTPSLHPVQLYSAALMFFFATWLWRRHARRPPEGELFASFLLGYGSYRLLLSPLRMEQLGSMTALSALFVVSGLLGMAWARRRAWQRSLAPAGDGAR